MAAAVAHHACLPHSCVTPPFSPPLPCQVWASACGADSPLLAPGTASKLASEDASAAAEAAEGMLTQHARHLGGEGGAAAATAARSIVLLLLHGGGAARGAAQAAAAAVAGTSPELANTLVAALQHWASNPAAPEVAAVLGEGALSQARFAAAAVAVAPAAGGVQLTASLASALLLLAHHPTVASPAGGDAAWAPVAAKLGSGVGDVLASDPAEVAAALVSSAASGAACPEAAQQAAACGALRAAMRLAAPAVFPALMDALRPLRDTSAHDALTARETKIFVTSPGAFSVWGRAGGVRAGGGVGGGGGGVGACGRAPPQRRGGRAAPLLSFVRAPVPFTAPLCRPLLPHPLLLMCLRRQPMTLLHHVQ